MRTSLAWHNLTHDRKRLALAVGGIGFAVLLMFLQLGFRGALFDSTLALPRAFDADLVLINPQRYTLSVYQKFPLDYLDIAKSVSQVDSTAALYFENIRSFWKRDDRTTGPTVRVLAFDPRNSPLKIDEVNAQTDLLERADSVLIDRKSKGDFAAVAVGDHVEIGGHRVEIVGTYELGTDFADDGTVISNDRTYNKIFFGHLPGSAGLRNTDVGLLRLAKGSDVSQVRDQIDALLPPDVLVLAKQDFLDFELKFWATSTPIGYIFMLGTVMGFLVGTIICYQILFSDIADHLREFATLKAMGYRPRYFMTVVLQESLLLSLFGFLPGLAISFSVYYLVELATGLVMQLDMARIVLVGVLTAVMCTVSGMLTMRTVLNTDPAELF